MAFEKTINGLARRNGQLKELQQGIALEVRVDRFLTGHAAQAFWGLIANGEHLLDHQRMGWRGWGLAGAGVTLQDLLQALACGQVFSQAFEPFGYPTLGTLEGGSQLGLRPGGMLLPQTIQIRSRSVV